MRDVVVTGTSLVGPAGIGLAPLTRALAAGAPLARAIDRSAGYHRPHSAQSYAGCAPFDLSPWLDPQAARRMSNVSQWTVAACRMAIADARLAGLPGDRAAGDRTGICMATTFGPSDYTERLVLQIQQKGGKAASPFLFTDCVASAGAGQAAIDLGARGPNTTICQREAGPLLAVLQGHAEIAAGRVDVCLCGGVEEMTPLVHSILDRFRALARSGRDGRELPRPFDRGRNGVLAGEGATVLVLESAAHARARGAVPLAKIGRGVRAFDPTAPRHGFGRGAAALAGAVRSGFGDRLERIAAVIASAAGSRAGDRLEAALLREVFTRLPPVVVPKAVHGEFAGGTLAAAMLALRGQDFGLPVGCGDPDPELGVAPHAGRIAGDVLVSALGSGGSCAFLLLERP